MGIRQSSLILFRFDHLNSDQNRPILNDIRGQNTFPVMYALIKRPNVQLRQSRKWIYH